MSLIDSFIAQKPDTCDAKGGNKKCWLFGSYALLRGSFREAEMDKLITLSQSLKEEGVAVVPVIDYKTVKRIEDSNYVGGYILQRKAPGKELHQPQATAEEYFSRINELAERPQEFYDKFAGDWLKITSTGLMIDPSKSSNFFYTPEQIHFIDLNPCQPKENKEISSLEASVALLGGRLYYKYGDDIPNKQMFQNILQKTTNAFIKNGADPQQTHQLITKNYPNIPLSPKGSLAPTPPREI